MPQFGQSSACQHFDKRKEYVATAPAGCVGRIRIDLAPDDEVGTCRRCLPLASINTVAVWRNARADEWCSERKVSEEQVCTRVGQPNQMGH